MQEARTASALNHPNILHIYDIDQWAGTDFIAMEFVPGQTLQQLIGTKGLPLAEVLKYAVQIASALARAHAAGIVHRDIKPANIMITEGHVKVLDFGLAKLTERAEHVEPGAPTETLRDTTSPRTEEGAIVGSINYMSPEQAEGKKVDARSDIFSFGSVLYEMITGRRAFEAGSKLATLSAILNKEPLPLGESVRAAPLELDQIVTRCLRKEPDRRFQHMSDLKVALEEAEDAIRVPSSTRRHAIAPLKISSRRQWLWAVSVALAVLALVVTTSPAVRHQLRDLVHPSGRHELLAVLPFNSSCADPAGQAFCDGLAEVVGRKLASLTQFQRSIRVLPPADIRSEPNRGPADARKALGATLALTGTLQQTPTSLRWTVILLDATAMRELRRAEAETPAHAAANLENILVEKSARPAGLLLPSKAQALLAAGETSIPESREWFLQAHGWLLNRNRVQDVDRAIDLFQKAVARDASYGLAHAGLCEAYWVKSALANDQQFAEKARQSCRQAIAAKADLAAVHVLLGDIYAGTGRPQGAVAEFQRALQLDPQSFRAHTGLGAACEAAGRLGDAEAAYRAAMALRP